MTWDKDTPWNKDVEGEQALELINSDAKTIRVQAGPGTGKTFGLVRRVQRILHPDGLDAHGNNILVVAFNRVIAKDLKSDIDCCLDNSPHNGEPVVRTVHALCLQVIGTPLRLLLPHERTAMLYDVLQSHSKVRVKYTTQKKADQALQDHEANLAEHSCLWQAVQRWLKRHNANLISDLPGLLLDRIKGGDYDSIRYDHVIVDEFQDLTPGEQLLFMRLRRTGGSLVVLGDPKQSIYRFRGNDRDGLDKLAELDRAADITDIPMPECRRSPRPMVDAANKLMGLYPPKMDPVNEDPANIHVVYWKTPDAEAKGMARCIVENVHAHPTDRHLAMVTRRRFGYLLRNEMRALDEELSVDLSFSESLIESWPVREAFLYFCLLVAPDAPTWRAWLGYKNPGDDGKFKAAKRNSGAYLRFLEESDDDITLEAIQALAKEPSSKQRGQGGKALWDRAKRFLDLEKELIIEEDDDGGVVVERIFGTDTWNVSDAETAELDMKLLQTKSHAIIEELAQARPEVKPREHLVELAKRLRYMIATREPFESDGTHDLQVTTLWGAKGVTAHHVYILGLCGEAVPGERRPEYPGTDEDSHEEQRRLFYVSITRSRRTLVLSRATKIRLGEAQDLQLSNVQHTSRYWGKLTMSTFLRDIISILPAAHSGDTWSGCVEP